MQMMNRKQQECGSNSELASRTGLLIRRGRMIAMASALALTPVITGFPQVSSQAAPHPVKSQVHQLGFVKSSVAAMRTAKNATRSELGTAAEPDPINTARSGAVASVQSVDSAVTVVGVTWPKGAATVGDKYQIRTLTGSMWSQWQSLDVATSDGPDPAEAASAAAATRGSRGTSPYVVTGAAKFEVRALSTDPAVPTSAKVQVVDPGASAADSNAQQAPGAAAAAAARPTIYSRAAWGANEGLRRSSPSYGNIMVGFVHHTDSSNSYTSAQVPAMIRGMYAYHVQSLGWADIGYNFLVDRFGRTWEGRYGGITRPVVGAQTLNFNSVSMGVSAIGNYDTGAVPQAMTNAFKAIFGWKFSLAGIPATGTVVANNKSLNRISGHRDAFATACPGRYLYAKLPEIRSGTAAIIGARAPVPPPPAPVAASRGAFSPGDFTGDRKSDIVAINRAGAMYLYRGSGAGGFSGGAVRIGTGWGMFSRVFSPGDFTGDGRADILGITRAGSMYLYRGNGAGGFTGGGTRIGTGWAFARVFSPGDYTGDRRADILGITSAGAMYLYRGNGAGGFTSGGTRIGTGWGVFL